MDQHPNQKEKQYVTNCLMFQLSYITIKLTACLNAGMEAQCSALLKVAENVHMRNCIMLQLVSLSSLLLAKACCKIFIKYVSTPAVKQMVSLRSLLWVWMHVVDFSLSVISFNACSFLISDFAAAKSELSSCKCWVLFIKQLESGRSSQFHLVFFLHFSYIYEHFMCLRFYRWCEHTY